MIAEEYFGRSRLLRRLKSGPHGQLVELYAALKEAALAKLKSYGHRKRTCFQPSDRLLAFLEAL